MKPQNQKLVVQKKIANLLSGQPLKIVISKSIKMLHQNLSCQTLQRQNQMAISLTMVVL